MHAFCIHCNQKMTSDYHSGELLSGTFKCPKLDDRRCMPGPLHLTRSEQCRQEALREMKASFKGDGSFDHAGVAKSLQDYP
jgi:hypothetical protein